jgi:hypothetical protein
MNTRHTTKVRRILGCLLVVGFFVGHADHASAQSDADKQKAKKDAGFGVPIDAKAAAEMVMKDVMGSDKLVSDTYSIVKAVIEENPFALVDALAAALAPGGSAPDISISRARDEIVTEIQQTNEEDLKGRAESAVSRLQELTEESRAMIADNRLANFLDDSSDLLFELKQILQSTDSTRAKLAYQLAPTYNIVTAARVAGLATAGYQSQTIDRVYGEALDTNAYLVSAPDGPDPRYAGYLYNYVVSGLDWSQRPFTNTTSNQVWCTDPPNAPSDFRIQSCDPITYQCTGGTLDPIGNSVDNSAINALCHDDIRLEAHARFDSDATIYSIRQAAQEQTLAIL